MQPDTTAVWGRYIECRCDRVCALWAVWGMLVVVLCSSLFWGRVGGDMIEGHVGGVSIRLKSPMLY